MEPTGFSASFSDEDMADPRASKLASDFISSKYKTLYDIAFRDTESWFSPSFAYLHAVASAMIAPFLLIDGRKR